VRIVRAGRQWTVHWEAYRRYHAAISASFDIVVDEVNTIPFFTPLWAGIPVVMFIHQLAREVWWYESGFPLNIIGFVAEPVYLRCYKRVPVLTVSASTRDDLAGFGFIGAITIVPEGLEQVVDVAAAKALDPIVLYVGRLTPSKRVTDVIQAFAMFRKAAPLAKLRLIGDGLPSYVQRLNSLAADLGIKGLVEFLGRVPPLQKHQEMARAHILAIASVREGWGLVVTEANSFGTPAVAYDVPGLRDSIRNEETGLLVPPSPKMLAEAMARLWRDPDLYGRLSRGARAWAATFSFDRTAEVFDASIRSIVAEHNDSKRPPINARG
jgi:glycosyltransferase involved in cell wall biosynthesis